MLRRLVNDNNSLNQSIDVRFFGLVAKSKWE